MTMQRMLCVSFSLLVLAINTSASATFSIVAVDPATGEVGSAGASCINGSAIISYLVPGRGAVHTQAYYLLGNDLRSTLRFDAGDSPQEVIDYMIANDVQGTPEFRQYGVVDFDPITGLGRSAAHTGTSTDDWKGHATGDNYAIQGNLLLGPEIVDDMESAFLGSSGPLANRLMAAMQAANVAGADNRCLDDGISSLSAFIRVGQANDATNNTHLWLNISSTPNLIEPIDLLQAEFNTWYADHDSDFDDDGNHDVDDLNALLAVGPVAGGVAVDASTGQFDMNGDGVINNKDVAYWLSDAALNNGFSSPYLVGDANLDGVVDVTDLNRWNTNKFTTTTNWSEGDFNGDGLADISDLNRWNVNKFQASDVAAVPEPAGWPLGLFVFFAFASRCSRVGSGDVEPQRTRVSS